MGSLNCTSGTLIPLFVSDVSMAGNIQLLSIFCHIVLAHYILPHCSYMPATAGAMLLSFNNRLVCFCRLPSYFSNIKLHWILADSHICEVYCYLYEPFIPHSLDLTVTSVYFSAQGVPTVLSNVVQVLFVLVTSEIDHRLKSICKDNL